MSQEPLAVEERTTKTANASDPSLPSAPDATQNGTKEGGEDVAPVAGSSAPEQRRLQRAKDADEALPLLRRPFSAEAIRFKIQGTYGEYGCYTVCYIDARLVTERLNLICASHWFDTYEATNDSLMICRIKLFDAEPREDVGEGKGKALRSDAFKRAAVKWGVGVSVYAAPRADLWWKEFGTDEGGKKYLKRKKKGDKWEYRLEPAGEAALRRRYQKWLDEVGIREFGEPIDHGDVAESAGEAPQAGTPEETTQSDLSAVKLPLTDEKADLLRQTARTIYGQVKKSKLPAARFNSELAQASTSHESLEAFAEKLRGLAE